MVENNRSEDQVKNIGFIPNLVISTPAESITLFVSGIDKQIEIAWQNRQLPDKVIDSKRLKASDAL